VGITILDDGVVVAAVVVRKLLCCYRHAAIAADRKSSARNSMNERVFEELNQTVLQGEWSG